MYRALLSILPLVLCAACYEDRIACLDPDATNYDLRADEACPDDCCTYPAFRVEIARLWGEAAFSTTDTFTDGALNRFRLLRFRYYLGGLELVAGNSPLAVPENPVEVRVLSGTDTLPAVLNANLVLAQSTGSNVSTVGTLRIGKAALTQVRGKFGLSSDFLPVFPPSAPSNSPLATQAGLLNFNDGRGYLQASAEYLLTATNDTLRVDAYGLLPFVLDFPAAVAPQRGTDLTVLLAADLSNVFGTINLAADSTAVVNALQERLPALLRVTGVR
ncbi:hypothetical protein QWY85_04210 [Neolewinella lacunae]|uniref:Uncharacterized protein n=1 Tax=Neolewinella lacunae TaxID=1517758 RepID=A0A923PJR4_9BACT|nr:hypothetical protein [Neolewinella lacunae]MBC6995408.1 hypothetical protein [Neolewinella lacunae]MDN3633849.1 hypothetical protein [Neolewinella lacunae]